MIPSEVFDEYWYKQRQLACGALETAIPWALPETKATWDAVFIQELVLCANVFPRLALTVNVFFDEGGNPVGDEVDFMGGVHYRVEFDWNVWSLRVFAYYPYVWRVPEGRNAGLVLGFQAIETIVASCPPFYNLQQEASDYVQQHELQPR